MEKAFWLLENIQCTYPGSPRQTFYCGRSGKNEIHTGRQGPCTAPGLCHHTARRSDFLSVHKWVGGIKHLSKISNCWVRRRYTAMLGRDTVAESPYSVEGYTASFLGLGLGRKRTHCSLTVLLSWCSHLFLWLEKVLDYVVYSVPHHLLDLRQGRIYR